MTPRMWIAVALIAVAATPAAIAWWLLRSLDQAIRRINP